jgi:hypothetical protein
MILQCAFDCPARLGHGGRIVITGTTGYHDGGVSINPISVATDLNTIFVSTNFGIWSFGYYTSNTGWGCESGNCFAGMWSVPTITC